MAVVIFKNDIPFWLRSVGIETKVVAPVSGGAHKGYDASRFKIFENGDLLDLKYGTTILPPKEFTLPPKETLFSFYNNNMQTPEPQNTLFFGVNLEDLEGMEKLDKIFEEPIRDEPYHNRRRKRLIVAVDRFSPPEDLSFDLYLMWLNEDLLAAFPKTKEGKGLVKNKFFKEHQIRIPKVSRKKDALLTNPKLAAAVASSKDHPIWKELAEICFGCGICSYACPLCYCFEVEDDVQSMAELKGERCRTWDSCMLHHFSETSAFNFRAALPDRIYNWYHHKFVRMPQEYGFTGCVGCNRCTIYCPSKINYRLVLQRILKDHSIKEKRREKPQLSTQKS